MTKKSNEATTATNTRAATKSAAKRKIVKKAPVKPSTHKLVWRDWTCRVKHTPNYINTGWSHLEIRVVTPKGAPLPITGTGYLSQLLDAELVEKAGGPVAFFQRWLDSVNRHRIFTPDRRAILTPLVRDLPMGGWRSCGAERNSFSSHPSGGVFRSGV
jgi:hypothetical protein